MFLLSTLCCNSNVYNIIKPSGFICYLVFHIVSSIFYLIICLLVFFHIFNNFDNIIIVIL